MNVYFPIAKKSLAVNLLTTIVTTIYVKDKFLKKI